MITEAEELRINVTSDLSRYVREIDHLERRSEEAGRRAGRAFGEGAKDLGVFSQESKTALQAVTGLAMVVGSRLVTGLRGAFGWVARTTSGLVDLGALGALKAAQAIDHMAESTRDANGELSTMGKAAKGASTLLESVATVALRVGQVILGLKGMIVLIGTATTIAAHRAAAEFAPAWSRVLTLLDKSQGKAFAFRGEVSRLASALGTEGTEAAETLYQILSAMPDLAGKSAESLNVLRVALEAATTGFVDAATAGKTITAILNAFGMSAADAESVSDQLVMAQKNGVTTWGEMATSIGTVADLTASLGLSLQDLLGILATTTDTNVTTAERFTQLRGVLSAIMKPTAEATEAAKAHGIELSAAALSAAGMNRYLADLIQKAGGNPDVLARLFPQESLSVIISLARQLDTLREKTEAQGRASGQHADAVERTNDTWERQKEILGQQLPGILRDLGFEFENWGVRALRAINGVFNGLRGLDEEGNKLARTPTPWSMMEEAIQEENARLRRGRELLPGRQRRAATPAELTREQFTASVVGRLFTPSAAAPEAASPEPATLEYAQEKVRALEQSLKATAIAQVALNQDTEAYARAMEAATQRVNAEIVAQAERLKAAGVEQAQIAELLELYEVVAERRDTARERLHSEAAAARTEMQSALAGLTATTSDDALLQLDRLADRARAVFAELGEAFPAELEKGLARRLDAILQAANLEGFAAELDTLSDAIASPASNAELERYIERLQDYAAAHEAAGGALAEGTELRERYVALLRQARQELAANETAIRDEAAATEEAARKAFEARRRHDEDALRNLRDQARTIEENVRGALQLAEAFGLVDTETARTLENVAQLAASIARIAGGDLTAIPSALGAVAGLFSSLRADAAEAERRRVEAQRALLEQLERNARAIEENTQAIAAGRTAGEITAGQAAGAGLLTRLRETAPGSTAISDINFVKKLLADPAMRELMQDIFAATGIDLIAEGEKSIQAGDKWALGFNAAWIAAEKILAQSAEHFGAIADTNVDGQLARFRQELELLDLDTATEQLEHFITFLDRIGAGGFADQLQERIAAGDIEGARAYVRELFAGLLTGQYSAEQVGSLFGPNVTADQIVQILGDVDGWLEAIATGGGVTGGGAAPRLNVSMTEVQGSTMLSHLATIGYHVGGMHALMRSGAGLAPPQLPSTYTPPSVASLGLAPQGSGNLTMGDVYVEISVPSGDPTQLAQWGQAGREVGAGIRSGFGEGLGRRLSDVAAGAGIDRARVDIRPR
jgi:TP901 family phage tail tape measure protein